VVGLMVNTVESRGSENWIGSSSGSVATTVPTSRLVVASLTEKDWSAILGGSFWLTTITCTVPEVVLGGDPSSVTSIPSV